MEKMEKAEHKVQELPKVIYETPLAIIDMPVNSMPLEAPKPDAAALEGGKKPNK
jgi:hypothetical protein